MEEIGIEGARVQLGEIVDRARLAGEPTRITRHGKAAAVVVGSGWYEAVGALLADLETLEEYRDRTAALRAGRHAARLLRHDRRVIHHIDGNPRNNDPSNLQIIDPGENG